MREIVREWEGDDGGVDGPRKTEKLPASDGGGKAADEERDALEPGRGEDIGFT